jgi:transposase
MQRAHHIDPTTVLAVSLELSSKDWKIAASDGRRHNASTGKVVSPQPQERLERLVERIERFKSEWKIPPGWQVVVIYEAGQDGFWIQRALQARGMHVYVVDAASIPVARQKRRAKTDRLDALLLLNTLQTWLRGEREEVRMVHAPDPQAEAQRHLPRDRGLLQKEMNQHRDRIGKLLRTVGCWSGLKGNLGARLAAGEFCCHDGTPLPQPLTQRLQREWERLQLVQRQFAALERSLHKELPAELQERIAQLAQLKGVGWVGAMRLVLELYWRNFHNRRQVGACVGLVAQPYDSGNSRSDQGISKQGNRRVRALLIELAWFWLRYQPDSALAQWFAKRTAGSGTNKRARRIAIVAVARRLAIELWRYLTTGAIPTGASLKKA